MANLLLATNLHVLESRIKAEALRLGFAFCGITTAEPPTNHEHYQAWVADGCHGEMGYLERQEPKRGNLEQVVPGARSIVAVGMNYSPPVGEKQTEIGGAATGVVARYARFDDYHETMWARLNALLAFVREIAPGTEGKAYCDTGPVTERDLAMRAGIGWIGKHTGLINRKLGNWFFLGELILDIALAPDAPETPHCGTCTRCIGACPTGAITAPYKLDARRCISYLTIELKGSIPEAMRPLIGNRIYGCDDCLAACPWNRFAVAAHDEAVQPRADLDSPELVALLNLTEDEFRAKFARSPIKRAKRRGLLRNVCVALGNVGGADALTALHHSAEFDPEPLVREHAEWAIAQIEAREQESRMRNSMGMPSFIESRTAAHA